MPRSLILMRHGHAPEAQDDFARPLSRAGRDAVRRAAEQLKADGVQLDALLASSAPRALETARIAAEVLGFSGEVDARRTLYLASPGTLLTALQRLTDSARSVLLVAHNPGLSSLATRVSGRAVGLHPAHYSVTEHALSSWRELSI